MACWCFVITAPSWGTKQLLSQYLFVDQAARFASDDNPGTAEAPLLTIGRAVRLATPGTTIFVGNGTYREEVHLSPGIPAASITLAAAKGQRPIINGAEVVIGRWAPAPETGNASAVFHIFWPKHTQMVFVDNQPLQQIGKFRFIGAAGVVKPVGSGVPDLYPGSFYYDDEKQILSLWLSDSSNPESHLVEVGSRNIGVELSSDTQLEGFDVVHCQMDSTADKGHAAVVGNGDRIRVTRVRCLNNDFAGMIIQGEDCSVQECEMAYNGNCGFTSSYGRRILLEQNETHHNNTRNYDLAWHGGSLKVVFWRDCRVIKHFAHHEGSGLWFDINVLNLLVADCRVEDIEGPGIYFEISRWGVFVNNVIRRCHRGIWSYSSDVLIAHNVVECCASGVVVTGEPRNAEFSQSASEPSQPVGLAVRNNMILNNIIVDAVTSFVNIDSLSSGNGPHFCDYNVYAWTIPVSDFTGSHLHFMRGWSFVYPNYGEWLRAGYDGHSRVADVLLSGQLAKPRTYGLQADKVVTSVGFADPNLRSLSENSPVGHLGRAIPVKLAGDYDPNRKPWERIAPSSGSATRLGQLAGLALPRDRVQPEPPDRMLFDAASQPPATPGIQPQWSHNGQYPTFSN